MRQKSNCPSCHAPEIPSVLYEVKKRQFFSIGLSHHEQRIKKNKIINHFWPKLNFLEVGSYPLPFFFFPSFSFFFPSLSPPPPPPPFFLFPSFSFFLPSLLPHPPPPAPAPLVARISPSPSSPTFVSPFSPPARPALTCLWVVKKKFEFERISLLDPPFAFYMF